MAIISSTSTNSRRHRHTPRAPIADINVTPFVDVMLVLLIIFMVTAPLLVTGVPVNLPDSRAKSIEQTQEEPVQLSINDQGKLFLDDDPISIEDLRARLQSIASLDHNTQRPRQIMLRADKSLDYGRVMRIIGEINHAGLTRIALVTQGSHDQQ